MSFQEPIDDINCNVKCQAVKAFNTGDFSQPINWNFSGPWLTAIIQSLNSFGALLLVYALRYGKAIIVVPITGLAPIFTILLSLLIYSIIPSMFLMTGIGFAIIAILILAFE